jgi:hypothetical protein
MSYNNSDLVSAFPSSVGADALQVASVLPPASLSSDTFSACVSGEIVSIPYRIYHDPALIDRTRLTARQGELLDCLLTRHHNGSVREQHLAGIIRSNNEWIPPFVVQLVGEYVVEILEIVSRNLDHLDARLYRGFLKTNSEFFALTKQRIISYWDCYYRGQRRDDYVGFKISAFMEHLLTTD